MQWGMAACGWPSPACTWGQTRLQRPVEEGGEKKKKDFQLCIWESYKANRINPKRRHCRWSGDQTEPGLAGASAAPVSSRSCVRGHGVAVAEQPALVPGCCPGPAGAFTSPLCHRKPVFREERVGGVCVCFKNPIAVGILLHKVSPSHILKTLKPTHLRYSTPLY